MNIEKSQEIYVMATVFNGEPSIYKEIYHSKKDARLRILNDAKSVIENPDDIIIGPWQKIGKNEWMLSGLGGSLIVNLVKFDYLTGTKTGKLSNGNYVIKGA